MPETNSEKILDFLQKTSEIFKLVKKYSLLIEQKLKENKAPLHAANELKSLVFHLYNAAEYPDDADINLHDAKDHLCRAFYDLHSLMISVYVEEIKSVINSYPTTTVANIFPDYGKTIRPEMIRILSVVTEIRSTRNTDIDLLNTKIPVLDQQLAVLENFQNIIESTKPDLNRYDQEKENEKHIVETKELSKKRKDKQWDIIKLILAAIMGGIVSFAISRYN